MKVIELKAENFKRLKAVEIRPDGAVVQINGNNAAGKTSVLDSIWAALGGRSAKIPNPVRDGEEKATVNIDLGEIAVESSWTEGGKRKLTVKAADGRNLKSPQTILDDLVGQLTFDPLAFSRMKPGDQLDTLREVSGLDLTEIENAIQAAFDTRTDVNREAKRLKAVASDTPVVDAPDEFVSVEGLMESLGVAEATNRGNGAKRAHHDRIGEDVLSLGEGAERLRIQLEEKEKELQAKTAEWMRLGEAVKLLEDADTDSIRVQISNAQITNHGIGQRHKAKQVRRELSEKADEATALSDKIIKLEADKLLQIKNASLPIDGLSMSLEGVTYNGVPFESASSAEQLRVSVAMGLAMNPKLRVMLIRDGSLLDDDNMNTLAEMASKADAQIWVERVGEGESGIIIEDGTVKGAS